MKIDKGSFINDFIDKNLRQYSIPVYQRNYEWSAEQCEKLFEDILQAHELDRYHFTGSVVYELLKTENKIDYYVIIDGQQRLTTIYILLKALIDVAETEAEKDTLLSLMFNQDKFKKYNIDDSSKLKLKPIKSDNQQLMLLMENRIDKMDKSSGIYKNYDLFCKLAKKALQENPNLSIERIYDGVEHLTCAMIKLEEEEQGKEQEIFERINSTGVPLSLADKIRNFVLMTEVDQDRLYEEYWLQIEQSLNKEQMSAFFLDYLNFKLDGFTREKEAYDDFKTVYRKNNYTNETMLSELLHYAKQYHILKLFPIEKPETTVEFNDPRYKEYKVSDPRNATYKQVNYYELLGERVNVESFAGMVRSVAVKLYELDSSIIERMAKNTEVFSGWVNPMFSYDENAVKTPFELKKGSGIYISTGYSAYDCICIIRELLKCYDLDLEEDFVYSARSQKNEKTCESQNGQV